MSLFLVRHAVPIDRYGWSVDDLERPLAARGFDQADALTKWFTNRVVRGVWSSQAQRCVDTVAGVAADHNRTVEIRRELTEGARPNELLELLREQAPDDGDLVMCSHGDLIPEVLNRLLREGLVVQGPRGCEKASIWELETRGRDLTRGIYTAAP